MHSQTMMNSDNTATKSVKHKFEFIADCLCLDFCNTTTLAAPEPNERFKTYDDLVLWGKMAEVLSGAEAAALYDAGAQHPKTAEATLRTALELRAALHRLFVDVARGSRPVLADVDILNAAIKASFSRQRILFGKAGFTLGWVQMTPLDRMMWPVVRSAVELLTGNELRFVRQCLGLGCSWLFMDRTRNHSRRWCSMEVCGNRAKARRFYRSSQLRR